MAKTLVVEDERQIAQVVCAYLEQAGYSVVTATDGRMALHQYRHEWPDLIVLDLMLPEMDGTVRDQEIELTPIEFNLPHTLASSPRRVFSRPELLDQIYRAPYEGYERAIDTHIKNLRHKIEADPRHPQLIETVYGVGLQIPRAQECIACGPSFWQPSSW